MTRAAALLALALAACDDRAPDADATVDADVTVAGDAVVTEDVDLDEAPAPDRVAPVDVATVNDVADAPDAPMRGLEAGRSRLLATYLARLRERPDVVQSNGLRGRDLVDVCALWSGLQPSARAVFLTVTARLAGSVVAGDGGSALDHVTALHRVVGGEGATPADPGSCGGGEWNRVIVSTDASLHAALVAASDRRGARRADGALDLADVRPGTSWRESRDLAGPHGPFTLSAETDEGAPRAQAHFFRDVTRAPATQPLGRRDVEALVDPMALEVDQDYDCVHASNPLCRYTFYGPGCLPAETLRGIEVYAMRYGAVDLAWRPPGCAL